VTLLSKKKKKKKKKKKREKALKSTFAVDSSRPNNESRESNDIEYRFLNFDKERTIDNRSRSRFTFRVAGKKKIQAVQKGIIV